MDKGRISALQMGLMLYPTVLATGLITLPSISAQYAKNDLWLPPLLATLVGLLTIYLATRLHELYPKQTVIQYSGQILGKIPGKIVGVVYFCFLAQITGVITREYADFVSGNFLFTTPILLIISTILLLAGIAVRGGVEMLARNAVIFTPIFILPFFILLLLIPDLDVKNIFPVLEHGVIPSIKGAAMPQAWFSECMLMSFFLPSLVDPQKGRKAAVLALIAIVASMIYINLFLLFLLGPDTGVKMYPVLVAFRYISVANLESLLLAMWVVGNYIKIGVFYYATSISFGQMMNLSDYRPAVFPIGLLIVVFSLWDLPNFPRLGLFLRTVVPFEIPTVLLLIPLLLLVGALIRKRKSSVQGESSR
ncbi:spore germination protein KB [Bacillus sp. 3255]|nr:MULTISPECIES: endospore germination permease [Bacillales]MDD9271929.1 endospore germination permease [Paenibacillus sp. MAHUQ-63]MDR6879548.1 spore germination protein KB [Bacillus sp. 3255]